MEKKLSPQEIEEQELAAKIVPLVKEAFELHLRRGNGVTLKKSEYIGDRTREIDEEVGKLKSKKAELKASQQQPNR